MYFYFLRVMHLFILKYEVYFLSYDQLTKNKDGVNGGHFDFLQFFFRLETLSPGQCETFLFLLSLLIMFTF